MKKTPLKAKTSLKRKTPLKAHTYLKSNTALQQKTPLRAKQKSARKLSCPYRSIFTNDMNICIMTGQQGAEPHHIFNKADKERSEKYGFMLPLCADWHRIQPYSIHQDQTLWNKYRIKCQEYFINNLGKTKEEWIAEFGRWYE